MGNFKDFMQNGGGSLFGGISSGLLPGIFSLVGGVIQNKYNMNLAMLQNKANVALQQAANKYNEKLVDKQNLAAMRQAELEFNRGTASAQIAQMRAAGLSKAGAINQLNGAGSYTPAPVNVAQAEAPTVDYGVAKSGNLFEGISNATEAMVNLSMQYAELETQKEMFDKELKFKERQQANIELNDQITRAGKDLDNQVAKLNLDSQKAFATARSLFDESQEYYETGDDFLKYLKESDEKTYNELLKDPNAVNVVNQMVNNTNQQREARVDLYVKNMTQEDQIKMVQNAAKISDNNVKISLHEVTQALRKAEQLGIQNKLLRISLAIADSTKDSTINATNKQNENTIANMTLDLMKIAEETEAFRRLSPSDKDKWYDKKNELAMLQDKRNSNKQVIGSTAGAAVGDVKEFAGQAFALLLKVLL